MTNIHEVSRVSLDDFDKHIHASWQALQLQNELSDVTLVCDGKRIQTHKMIISSYSPVFRSICHQNFTSSPVIYLRGVNYATMSNLLNFMYQGQADVAQEDLNYFFAVAEDLEIKGLCTKTSTDVMKDDIIDVPDISDGISKPYNNNETDMEINTDNKELLPIDDNTNIGGDMNHSIPDKELVPIDDNTNIREDMNHCIPKIERMQDDPTNEDLLKALFSDVDQHRLEEKSAYSEELEENFQYVETKHYKKILRKKQSIKKENNMEAKGATKQKVNKVVKLSTDEYQHTKPLKKEILPISKQLSIKTDTKYSLPTSEDINHKNDMEETWPISKELRLEKSNENNLPKSKELVLKYKEETKDLKTNYKELDFKKDMIETVPLSTELISNLKEETKQISKKSLICMPCKTQFASNSDLKRHKETEHANSLAPSLYTCDKCGHKTVHKGNLKKHMESIHEGIRYPCTRCNYKGTQKVSLVLHIKSMHKQ